MGFLSSNCRVIILSSSCSDILLCMYVIHDAHPPAVDREMKPLRRNFSSCKPESTLHAPSRPVQGGSGSPSYPACVYLRIRQINKYINQSAQYRYDTGMSVSLHARTRNRIVTTSFLEKLSPNLIVCMFRVHVVQQVGLSHVGRCTRRCRLIG